MVSASIPGPARPRGIGSSAGSAISTRVGPGPVARLRHELRADQLDDDGRGRPPLEHLAHLGADALELIEPLALHVERHELDLDARQMVRQRLSPRRRAPGVRADRLGGRRRGGVRPEQSAEEPEGELAVVRRESLGQLAPESALELRIRLAELLVEVPIAVALGGHGGERGLEPGDLGRELRDRHRRLRRRVRHGAGVYPSGPPRSRQLAYMHVARGVRSAVGTPSSSRARAAPSMRTPGAPRPPGAGSGPRAAACRAGTRPCDRTRPLCSGSRGDW